MHAVGTRAKCGAALRLPAENGQNALALLHSCTNRASPSAAKGGRRNASVRSYFSSPFLPRNLSPSKRPHHRPHAPDMSARPGGTLCSHCSPPPVAGAAGAAEGESASQVRCRSQAASTMDCRLQKQQGAGRNPVRSSGRCGMACTCGGMCAACHSVPPGRSTCTALTSSASPTIHPLLQTIQNNTTPLPT